MTPPRTAGSTRLLCGRWRVQVNPLWQWCYSGLGLAAHAYLLYRAVQRCTHYNQLPWITEKKPVEELYIYIALIVLSIICLPFFCIAAVFKAFRLWTDAGPWSSSFHLLAATLLLLPVALLDAQQIRHGFISTDNIWKSDLDFVFKQHPSRHVTSGITNNHFNGSHGIFTWKPLRSVTTTAAVSPEFVNYFVALMIYSIRYAAVFWCCSLVFAAIFLFQLLFQIVLYVFSINAVCVLYKLRIINDYSITGTTLNPVGLMLVYSVSSLVLFLSSFAVFQYGHQHYSATYRNLLNSKRPPHIQRRHTLPAGCHGYMSHSLAALALVLLVCTRSPLIYDLVGVFRQTQYDLVLVSVVLELLYLLFWIVLWFIFTLKHKWDFAVIGAMSWGHTELQAGSSTVFTIQNANATTHGDVSGGKMSVAPHYFPPPVAARPEPEPQTFPATPTAPNSSLRTKSRERRISSPRVTFGREVITHNLTPDSASDLEKPPNGTKPRQYGNILAAVENAGIVSHPLAIDIDIQERRTLRSSAVRKNLFGDFSMDSTPDNTLTRDYRYSLKETCDKYYRADSLSPPATQSSQHHTNGVVLSPSNWVSSTAAAQINPYLKNASLYRALDKSTSAMAEQPTVHDVRALSSTNYDFREHHGPPLPRTSSRITDSGLPPIRFADSPSDQRQYTERRQTRSSSGYGSSFHSNRYSDPVVAPSVVTSSRERKKPDIGSRDSALPSSNETSSNESQENILCSQV